MRQRHSHPRIGPEYQATIPSLEGGPYPQVPVRWLGESAAAAEGAPAGGPPEGAAAASGRGSLRSRAGAASSKQNPNSQQGCRPVSRQMRATTRGAAAARDAESKEEQQQEQQQPVEDVTFSASLFADAARELKEGRLRLSGERFEAGHLRSTGDEPPAAAAAEAKEEAAPTAAAAVEPVPCGGEGTASSLFTAETVGMARRAREAEREATAAAAEAAAAAAAASCAGLRFEIPHLLTSEVPAQQAAAAAGSTAAADSEGEGRQADASAASTDLLPNVEDEKSGEKHSLPATEERSQWRSSSFIKTNNPASCIC
ncbi:hypothetical protein Efla_007539 [Eimeria flavescens]